jgi:putative membrane-bound dehydrogenase-like protein
MPIKLTAFVCLLLLCGCSRRNDEERALTPENSLETMHLSGDFQVELFTAEPEVMSPVDLTFDENGKIYVAEMLDYPEDPPPGKAARSRIRLLQDTKGDGKIERSTIFADNVLGVSGIMPWKGGPIVPSAPHILFLKDTNGDGKADLRKVLYTGFPVVRQEARVTNPRLSVDNWIYCSNTGENGRITSPDHPDMALFWCVVLISDAIRLRDRPKLTQGRRSSAQLLMTSEIDLSPKTPLISGM